MDFQQYTFMDSEIQQAQRHARTQEFKTAVERAQQARVSRSKLSEISVNSDSVSSKPCDFSDCRTAVSNIVSSKPSNQSGIFPFPPNLPVSQVFNSIPPHLLFQSAFHCNTGHSPEMAAAFAAATAAMAYSGGSGQSGSLCTSSKNSIPLAQTTSTSNLTANNPWSVLASLVSGASTSAAIAGIFSQPHMSQFLHNVLCATSSSNQVQFSKSNVQPQSGMYFDPDYFVERFLEILNQQQQQQQQQPSMLPKNAYSDSIKVSHSFSLNNSTGCGVSFVTTTSSCDKRFEDQKLGKLNTKESFLTQSQFDKDRRFANTNEILNQTDVSNCVNIVSSNAVNLKSTMVNENPPAPQRLTNCVPGLMDVEVSCASSQHLYELWEKENYLLDSSVRGHRTRGKQFGTTAYKTYRGSASNRGQTSKMQYSSDTLSHDFSKLFSIKSLMD